MAGVLVALVMLDTFLTGYLLVKVNAAQKLTVHSAASVDKLTDVVDQLPCQYYGDDICVKIGEEDSNHE